MTAAEWTSQTVCSVPPRTLAGERWLSVVTHLDPRFGGLSAAVPQLAQRVAEDGGCSMALAAFCCPDERYDRSCLAEISLTEWPIARRRWLFRPTLRASFSRLIQSAQGVHVHGLWDQSTLQAARAARRFGIPYIISAHGMLDAWALRQKAVKKYVYSTLYERENLAGAACLHALTEAEADDYRRFGCKGPIATIPNGVELPNKADAGLFLRQHPALQGKRIVLYLGRLHAKKGLDLLVEVWRGMQTRHPEARLVLAGPDFDGTHAHLSASINRLGLSEAIVLPGMLRDEMKWSALAAAEAFVLPSFSEGLSVSVLEAMGSGLPVIISRACNLPEVERVEAGTVIDADAPSLQGALDTLLARSPDSNRLVGSRGRAYVDQHFSWPSVSADMVEVYRWVRQGGPPPPTVSVLAGTRASSEIRR